jgi:hypothetical protein
MGLPRNDFGKAVREMLERWTGLIRLIENPRIPLDDNALNARYAGQSLAEKSRRVP